MSRLECTTWEPVVTAQKEGLMNGVSTENGRIKKDPQLPIDVHAYITDWYSV